MRNGTGAEKEKTDRIKAPRWDLSDLYQGMKDPAFERDMRATAGQVSVFRKDLEGKIAKLNGADLKAALDRLDALEEQLGKISAYSFLLFAADSVNPETGRFQQDARERLTRISADLLFFSLEINEAEEAVFEHWIGDPHLAEWRSFLIQMRRFRPYQRSVEMEKLLLESANSGNASWVRLFDETMAGMQVFLPSLNKEIPINQAFEKTVDADRTVREEAGKSIAKSLEDKKGLFALISNVLAADKAVRDRTRGFAFPAQSRHLSNCVEPEMVDALQKAVTEALPRLSHRYYQLKAEWLGLDKLQYWDRNAPLSVRESRKFSWEEAQRIVTDSYQKFDPEMGALAERFFANPWIDAEAVPGKAGGAFAHPVTPDAHPYILVNFQGKIRDVMTLAHEVGHGIHQILAGESQGYLRASTPLVLAETASVFGEMLTFRFLLSRAESKEEKRLLLAGKVEDMLNTVVRQMAFYGFEQRFHAERGQGEVPAARIGEIWRETQKASLGPAFELAPEYDLFWSYIPHFIHTPFYVYAYAFGDCLVNALYGSFERHAEGFADKYRAMLRAGGTKMHQELLRPFGLDATSPDFWNRGLKVIEGFIDDLEKI